jgi:TM2 domain-containing membrane protein YozV
MYVSFEMAFDRRKSLPIAQHSSILLALKHQPTLQGAVPMFGFGIPHPFFALFVLAILLIFAGTDHKKQARTSDSTAQGTISTKYCHACGTQISFHAEICPKCGVRQALQSSKKDRSRVTAALFAIFLGGLGIHKFYLGYIVEGLIYLVFCWTFIPSIVGFIEGIMYLSMSDLDFNNRYNS